LAGLGLLFLVSNFAVAESFNRFLAISIIPLFVFAIGLILAFYSYNLADRINDWFDRWKQRASHGSIQLVFVVAGGLVGIVGFVISLFSVGEVYTERTTQAVVLFLINFLWFAVFAVLIYVFGAILDGYIYSRKLRYIFITIILNMVSIGLIANGILDYLMAYVGLYHTDNLIIIVEIVAGFMMTIVAAALQVKVRKIYYRSVPSDKGNPVNEVQ
jgi:putative membrane protein